MKYRRFILELSSFKILFYIGLIIGRFDRPFHDCQFVKYRSFILELSSFKELFYIGLIIGRFERPFHDCFKPLLQSDETFEAKERFCTLLPRSESDSLWNSEMAHYVV